MTNDALPEFFSHSGVEYLVVQLAFVVLLVAGLTAVWGWIRGRFLGTPEEWSVLVAEATLAGPWLLFPALFGLSLAGAHRAALTAAQAGLVLAGAVFLFRRRREIATALRLRTRVRWSVIPTVMSAAAVSFFVVWGWLMPFPESFNGHYHAWMSQVAHLWQIGEYRFVENISNDNAALASPAPTVFFLSLFTLQGIDDIALRPVFFVPGVFAFVTLQLLRATAAAVSERWVGSVAFLLLAFNYYTVFEFTEITGDLFTACVLIYFGDHTVRLTARRTVEWFPYFLVLAFTALIRKQVFLLLVGVVVVLLIARIVPWRTVIAAAVAPRRGVALVALTIAAPVVVWSIAAGARYGNPLYPQSETAQTTADFGFDHLDVLLSSRHAAYDEYAGRGSSLLEHFFPAFPDRGLAVFVKNLFGGLSVSFAMAIGVLLFLVLAGRLSFRTLSVEPRRLRALAVVYVVGFVVVDYIVFPGYDKFQHYIYYMVAIFP